MKNPEFNMLDYLRGREVTVVNKAQEASPINDLIVFISIVGGYLVLCAVVSFIYLFVKEKEDSRLKEHISTIFESFRKGKLNRTIQFIDVLYI